MSSKLNINNKKVYLHLACLAYFTTLISALTCCTGCSSFVDGYCFSWSLLMSQLPTSSCYLPYNVILEYSVISNCWITNLLSSSHDAILHLRKEGHCAYYCLDRNHSRLGISWRHYYWTVCWISSSLMSLINERYWYLAGCSCSSFHWIDLGSWLDTEQVSYQ